MSERTIRHDPLCPRCATIEGNCRCSYEQLWDLAHDLKREIAHQKKLVAIEQEANAQAWTLVRERGVYAELVTGLLRDGVQWATGDLKLRCLPDEGDRTCMNRCRSEWLDAVKAALATPPSVRGEDGSSVTHAPQPFSSDHENDPASHKSPQMGLDAEAILAAGKAPLKHIEPGTPDRRAAESPAGKEPDTAEAALARQGVYAGMGGLRGLAEASEFWESQMYGTRLYYGPGGGQYLHRSVLKAAVDALDGKPPYKTPAVGTEEPKT